jgi:hypothetical protein
LNVDSVVVPPGLKTKILRYRPSAVVISDRNIAFRTPLHLPSLVSYQGVNLLHGKFPLWPDPFPEVEVLWEKPYGGVYQSFVTATKASLA